MKATLDHVGIAVRDIHQALAFYRDALGLSVEVPEEVEAQRVRAHFIPVGAAALELLEPTASESVIARYIEKRGPGLHHITLRVEDIRAALAHLKSRGVRLVDEQPRAGAEGALVAFIHPVSAHGVLVELKELATATTEEPVQRLAWGDLQLTSVQDGVLRLDGGAAFGAVPRMHWERKTKPDDQGRARLAMRPLLVEASWGRMLIDCGAGDPLPATQGDLFGTTGASRLDQALENAGVSVEAIDVVLATHLHVDHWGGAVSRRGRTKTPRFPRATYLIRRDEWEAATRPNALSRHWYRDDDVIPLQEAGVVHWCDDDDVVKPGVRVVRTGGHTAAHQVVFLESRAQSAVFAADLIPTTAHVEDDWILGYDLFPTETVAFKARLIREAVDREHLIFFEHDPVVSAGYIRERAGRRYVERVL